MSLVARAQRTSLLGVHDIGEQDLPYESLGEDKQPYDLGNVTAVKELKTALVTLGYYWSDKLARPDPSTETRWSQIDLASEGWEPAAADELAFAIGRLRGAGWQVKEPYAFETPVGPQPTPTGLELIAGAVNQLLGGSPRMAHYEAWRGGVMAPPSVISGPSATDPVTPNYFYGTAFKVAPANVEGGVAAGLQMVRTALTEAWKDAMAPDKDESYRREVEKRIIDMRAERDKLVEIAIANAPPREGKTVVEHVAAEQCTGSGGVWNPSDGTCVFMAQKKDEPSPKNYVPWVVLGLGALGVGYAWWKSRGPSYAPARRGFRG